MVVRGGAGARLEPKPSVKQQRGSSSHGETCPGFPLSSARVRGAGMQVVMEAPKKEVKSVRSACVHSCSAGGRGAQNGLEQSGVRQPEQGGLPPCLGDGE